MTIYGLQTSDNKKSVPLKDIQVLSSVNGFIANVEYTLVYQNEEDNPIEAIFTFPLDEKSAIYRFEALIEGRLIVGECQDKDQAQQTYDDAIEAGESAFLMEESDESGDVFQCQVGNLPPHTDATIIFAYVIELDIQADKSVKFVVPAILGLRYGGPVLDKLEDEGSDGDGPPAKKSRKGKKKHLRPTYVKKTEVPYEVHFNMEVKGHRLERAESGDVTDVLSLDYKNKEKTLAQVQLENQFTFDHDLVVYLFYEDLFHPHVAVETADPEAEGLLKESVAMVSFYPDLSAHLKDNQGRGEYIFVIDRSGSMNGDYIEQAKNALLEFLKVLPSDCYFNIVSFGSDHSSLFEFGSEQCSATALEVAVSHTKGMSANFGGTEILSPLKDIYKKSLIAGYPRQIFLLTDGQVWNTQEVVRLVQKNADTSRVFTFGIGSGASTALVKGLARAGKGRHEFVHDAKKLPQKVKATLQCAMQPNVQDVTLKWTGVKAITIPTTLPPIYHGERMLIFALLKPTKGKGKEKLNVTLSGKINDEKVDFGLDFDLKGSPSITAPIHRLAAKAQIKELQDEEGYTESNKDTIILLSTASNVISKYTSYVGVDHGREEKVTGDMETRHVPLPAKEATRTVVQPGPSSYYGGAPEDAVEAAKYVDGKEILPPLDPDILPEIKNLAITTETEDNTLPKQDKPATKPSRKRTRRGKVKLTHTKKHSKPMPTEKLAYVEWKDGFYYPIKKICKISDKWYEVKFRDGENKHVKQHHLVAASYLTPGDVVGLRSTRAEYEEGVILEYDAFYDEFFVASHTGIVYSLSSSQIILTKETGEAIKKRTKVSIEPKLMCYYPRVHDAQVAITTTDMAELSSEGWINDNLVEFYLKYLWTDVLSEDEAACTHYLSPRFFTELQTELWGLKHTRDSEQLARYNIVKKYLKSLDLKNKYMLFVPIFEITHWYVIAIRLDKKDDKRLKASFLVMDSYFASKRPEEIRLLTGVLSQLCQEQDLAIEFASVGQVMETPVQENMSDCGLCMLHCIESCFKDDLDPKPSLKWFTADDLLDKREIMAKVIMENWVNQNNTK